MNEYQKLFLHNAQSIYEHLYVSLPASVQDTIEARCIQDNPVKACTDYKMELLKGVRTQIDYLNAKSRFVAFANAVHVIAAAKGWKPYDLPETPKLDTTNFLFPDRKTKSDTDIEGVVM